MHSTASIHVLVYKSGQTCLVPVRLLVHKDTKKRQAASSITCAIAHSLLALAFHMFSCSLVAKLHLGSNYFLCLNDSCTPHFYIRRVEFTDDIIRDNDKVMYFLCRSLVF